MNRNRGKPGIKWWGDWAIVWIVGGFALVYLALVPLDEHPLHWLFSLLGGVVGYALGIVSGAWLPRLRRLVRRGPGLTPSGQRRSKKRRKR